MTNDKDLREITITSHWTPKQEAYYYEQLEKAGYEVIVVTTSEKLFPSLSK